MKLIYDQRASYIIFHANGVLKLVSMSKKIGIYKITSPSGKIYIGRSVNIDHRKWKYKSCNCVNQAKIYNSIKKYGWDKHKFEIICICQSEELDNLERHFISLYKSNESKTGLNILSGGRGTAGRVLSNESKKRIGDAHRGKLVSSETRKKMSIGLMGKTSWSKGKKLTQQHVENLRKSLKGRLSPKGMLGKKWSKETREKFLKSSIGVSRNKGMIAYQYPVIQYDGAGKIINEWLSAKEASTKGGYNSSLICACCKGKRNHHAGFIWSYKNAAA